MNNEQNFDFTYNAPEQQEVLQIRNKYLPREESKLDILRALDAKVKRPANLFAYVFGAFSAIVMGAGMSLVMTDIGAVLGLQNTMVIGICTGVLGLAMALLTYPIYKAILKRRKNKYGAKILQLSEELMAQ